MSLKDKFQSTLLLRKRKNPQRQTGNMKSAFVSIHSPFKEEKEQRLDR
ncbi:hypothetical protein LEP1GSC018_0148 [Leptospira kirschneri str. 2008720114]|nr:hypothetical protein LEP1GSC018_0148 [Leptospira kirschneri str. 2008720114]